MKQLKWLLLVMLLPTFGFGQSGLTVGYNLGMCNPAEVNRFIYSYNQMRPFLTKPMDPFSNWGGLSVAFIEEFSEGGGLELKWINHHSQVSAEAPDSVNNTSFERDLKIRSNTINLGGYGAITSNISIGGSLDFGNFKGYTRVADKEIVKDTAYTKVFQTESHFLNLQIASTIFVQYHTGPIGLRLFYQYQWMRMPLDGLDNTLINQNIDDLVTPGDKFSNMGVELFFKLGGY